LSRTFPGVSAYCWTTILPDWSLITTGEAKEILEDGKESEKNYHEGPFPLGRRSGNPPWLRRPYLVFKHIQDTVISDQMLGVIFRLVRAEIRNQRPRGWMVSLTGFSERNNKI
jgi:hypothetical protein